MPLSLRILGSFVGAALTYLAVRYAVPGVSLKWPFIFAAGALGLGFAGSRQYHNAPLNLLDKIGYVVATIIFVGEIYYLAENAYDVDFIGLIFFVGLGFLIAVSVYGYFAIAGMILLSGPDLRRRPGPSYMPYSVSDIGGDIDEGVYGRPDGQRHLPPKGGTGKPGGKSHDPNAPRIPYQPVQEYSTDYAVRLLNEAKVDGSPSSDTKAARDLAGYCLGTFGVTKGMAFLNQAARDDRLPKKARQFYAHALQEMERGG